MLAVSGFANREHGRIGSEYRQVFLLKNMTSDSAKPIKQPDFDRPKPINDARLAALEELSALDQKLELEYGIIGNPMIKAQPCTAAKTDATLTDPEIAVEILRLRVAELEEAIRRLAEQDATLSVCEGNVTVTMDATLTDAERQAIKEAADAYEQNNGDPDCERIADTLHGLLDRMPCATAGREGTDG